MGASSSATLRCWSVSSMRSTNWPPCLRAYSQLNSAVRTPPILRNSVGLGANLVRIIACKSSPTGKDCRCTGMLMTFVENDLPLYASELMANQLFGVHYIFEALTAGNLPIERIYVGREARSLKLQDVIDLADKRNVPVRREERAILERMAP